MVLNLNNLTNKQLEVLRDKSRFKVVVTGRRGGKTGIQEAEIIKSIAEGEITLFIAPTLKQAKKIIWDRVLQTIPSVLIKSINKSDYRIYSKMGGFFGLESNEARERIRGYQKIHHVLIDEMQDMDIELIDQVIYPAIADSKGSILATGTPKGYNALYDLTKRAEWTYHTWTTAEGGLVDIEEVERARLNLDPRTFRQEYEASFESYEGIIYYAFNHNLIVDTTFESGKMTYLSFDFNVNPMTCVVIQDNVAVKEYEEPLSNTRALANKILNELGEQRYEITGDGTGAGFHTSATQSNYDILYEIFGKKPRYRHVKHIEDRFNTLNTAFHRGEFKISKTCKKLIEYLQRLTREDIKKGARNTHLTDALSYYPYNYLPIKLSKFEQI